ncbi:polynucleotide 5'-hydroxyl-kinase [Aureococcus anophagefferens]|nr:polynucleotide 5'-hydroxyl-kinase [Aureococcus anophagefferens]
MNDNTTFWSPDPSRLVVALQPGERVVVVGSAWLRCLAGACEVHGHALEAGAPRVLIHSTRALPPCRCAACPRRGRRRGPRRGPGLAAARRRSRSSRPSTRPTAAERRARGAGLGRRGAPTRARLAGCAAFRVGEAAASGRLEPPRRALAAAAGRAPCGVVVGAKGAGKSTFCRQLLNGLGRAALLELDVGQPSAGPPACLSLLVLDGPLLAPPHLCARELGDVKRRYFFGDNTPRDDPGGYLDAAAALHGLWLSERAAGVPPRALLAKRRIRRRRPRRNGASRPRGDVADAIANAAPRVADWRRLSVAYVGGAADFAPASAPGAATLRWSGQDKGDSTSLQRPGRRRPLSADLPRDLVAAAGGVPAGARTGRASGRRPTGSRPRRALASRSPRPRRRRRRLWSPAASLDGCDVLLRGRLAPPVDLLYRGPARHGAFAFLSSESLDRDDLATAMKSRSNIGRKAHKADAAS